jgi:septation ring formation regulator EzrA
MSSTVRVCKDNINTALDQINRVTESIAEHEDVVEILVERRAMVNSEFEVYIKSMWRAKELSKYFKEELAYFRDSYAIGEKLVGQVELNYIERCSRDRTGGVRQIRGGEHQEAA